MLRQEFQSPIYRGHVDVGILDLGLDTDFFGADVIVAGLDGFHYHHPLRGKTIASLPENV